MTVMQLSGLISRILWGLFNDFIFLGRRIPVLQIIGAVTVAGLIGLALLNKTISLWVIWVVVSLAGAGSNGYRLLGSIVRPAPFWMDVDVTQSYRLAWSLYI